MKVKKLAVIIFVMMMLISALAIPASAATQDHYHTFNWEGSTRYDSVDTV